MQGCLKNLSVEGGCEGAHARPALFQSIQRAELMKNVPWAISMPLEHWAILRAQALRPREACRKCLRSTTLHLQKAVAVEAGLTPALPTSLSKRRPLRGCAQGSFQGRFAVLLHGGRLPG